MFPFLSTKYLLKARRVVLSLDEEHSSMSKRIVREESSGETLDVLQRQLAENDSHPFRVFVRDYIVELDRYTRLGEGSWDRLCESATTLRDYLDLCEI